MGRASHVQFLLSIFIFISLKYNVHSCEKLYTLNSSFVTTNCSVRNTVQVPKIPFTITVQFATNDTSFNSHFYERTSIFGCDNDYFSNDDIVLYTNLGYLGIWHGLLRAPGLSDVVYDSTIFVADGQLHTVQFSIFPKNDTLIPYPYGLVLYLDGVQIYNSGVSRNISCPYFGIGYNSFFKDGNMQEKACLNTTVYDLLVAPCLDISNVSSRAQSLPIPPSCNASNALQYRYPNKKDSDGTLYPMEFQTVPNAAFFELPCSNSNISNITIGFWLYSAENGIASINFGGFFLLKMSTILQLVVSWHTDSFVTAFTNNTFSFIKTTITSENSFFVFVNGTIVRSFWLNSLNISILEKPFCGNISIEDSSSMVRDITFFNGYFCKPCTGTYISAGAACVEGNWTILTPVTLPTLNVDGGNFHISSNLTIQDTFTITSDSVVYVTTGQIYTGSIDIQGTLVFGPNSPPIMVDSCPNISGNLSFTTSFTESQRIIIFHTNATNCTFGNFENIEIPNIDQNCIISTQQVVIDGSLQVIIGVDCQTEQDFTNYILIIIVVVSVPILVGVILFSWRIYSLHKSQKVLTSAIQGVSAISDA